MIKTPELLAPAGDLACFRAALKAGANAIYLGIGVFNMRRVLDGKIEFNQLPNLVKEAHAANVKVYVTVNTLVYQGELEHLHDSLTRVKAAGVDAIIASDWAVILYAKQIQLPVHISTQMSAANSDTVRFLMQQGAERIVLARECTLEEIKAIIEVTGVEIEVFVHGAQCVATSGRCFLSQLTYGCSASRGQCQQPCRRKYHIKEVVTGEGPLAEFEVGTDFILSAKDLCSLEILPQLVEAGIASLKIEGRARNPEYVAAVTRAYRIALDAIAKDQYTDEVKAECMRLVSTVYHRPFATGLLLGRPGVEQFTHSDDNYATEKKVYLGIVRNFFAKPSIAEVYLHDKVLHAGDRIAIHGPKTGVLELAPTVLRQDDATVESISRGQWCTFKVDSRVRPGDKVFAITKVEPPATYVPANKLSERK